MRGLQAVRKSLTRSLVKGRQTQTRMFKVIGADQKEYGPVTAEQLRRWIAEGRAGGQTMVQAEGTTEWKLLSTFPEFADDIAVRSAGENAGQTAGVNPGLPEDIFSRDYGLDIGNCIGSSWELLKSNFGLIFGGVAVFLLVQVAVSLLGRIPLIGIVLSIASLVVTGPLTGGLYLFLLKNIRRQAADIGDVFSGFRLAFLQLLLGYLVPAGLTCLAALPGAALMAFPIIRMVHERVVEPGPFLVALLGGIVAIIPMIYLGVSWMFTLPIIIDKQMDFWPAMNASRKMVGKHWWQVLGLVVVCGLVNVAGILACCVGLLISLPIVLGALMYAYERIFSPTTSQTP